MTKKDVKTETWCKLPLPLTNDIKDYFTPILKRVNFLFCTLCLFQEHISKFGNFYIRGEGGGGIENISRGKTSPPESMFTSLYISLSKV